MNRPSKKDIKAAVEGLKKSANGNSAEQGSDNQAPAPPQRKAPNRIRKKGV